MAYYFLFLMTHWYPKGYALCRWPLLASRDCHLGALVLPFLYSGSHFGTSAAPSVVIFVFLKHLEKPFWHFGTTLEDHGSSRMDTKLQITGLLSISEWFRHLFLSVLGIKNAYKCFLFLGVFPGHLFIYFCIDISKLRTSQLWFSHGKYFKKTTLHENRFLQFSGSMLVCLGGPWGRVSCFLRFENRFENETFFVM